jgi:ABC-type phosphate transport system substrate-binding protein
MRTAILPIVFFIIGTISLLSLAAAADPSQVIIIANNQVMVDGLQRSIIADIYQGRKGKWDTGQKIMVTMLKKGSAHETFTSRIVQTTPMKLKTLWKKVIFSGAGTPPKVFKAEKDLMQYVAATAGAIGYISAQTEPTGVKIITVK